MAKNSILQFDSYKKWLQKVFNAESNRGLMSQVSRQMGCQTSYLSRVLNGKLQLTPEYAYKVTEALHLTHSEQEYFLLLVDFERSSDQRHRAFIRAKMKTLSSQHAELGETMRRPSPEPAFDHAEYFSNWLSSAIHLWCATPGPHTIKSIALKFKTDPSVANKMLEFLQKSGFVTQEKNGTFKYASGSMHVDRRSPFAIWNHSNFRQVAMQDAHKLNEHSLHFTNLQTMTHGDYDRVRNLIMECIEKMERVALPSAPEQLVVACFDLFLVD